jgi:hypothetical protein
MSLILSGTDGLSDVDGSAATPAIRGTDANTGIFFPAADTIGFAEGGAEVMRIDSSGHVIVGYTASVGTAYQTNIQVKGNSASGYAGYGVITSNNESAGLFGAYSNGENSLWIASDPDNLRAGSRTVFTVDGTQTAQINPFGIGVGSATPTSGTGITFPATQSASSDANTLDDYEEGTWTPTSGVALTQLNSPVYTKVGRLVVCSFDFQFASSSSGSTVIVSGLPFTPAVTDGGTFVAGYTTYAYYLFGPVQVAGFVQIYGGSGNPSGNPTYTNLSGLRLMGTITYHST